MATELPSLPEIKVEQMEPHSKRLGWAALATRVEGSMELHVEEEAYDTPGQENDITRAAYEAPFTVKNRLIHSSSQGSNQHMLKRRSSDLVMDVWLLLFSHVFAGKPILVWECEL